MRSEPKTTTLQKAINGDEQAFTILYDENIDVIYRFVEIRVGDPQTAEDLTSKIFMKSWEKLSTFQDRGVPFRAWVFRIARNAIIDHYRTRKDVAPLELVSNTSDGTQPMGEKLANDMDAEQVLALMEQLTSSQRQVLILRLMDGLTTDEAAANLNKRAGAVRALHMRALHRMTKLLKGTSLKEERELEFT